MVLDKTGTLTLGNPEVVAIHARPGVTERELLEAAATAERLSEHPVAKAILKRAVELHCAILEPSRFGRFPGKGVVRTADGDEIVVGSPAPTG